VYRIRQSRQSEIDLSLDSLMDVLSCSVGVMLFIVIIGVLEARGTNILLYSPPLLREPPANSNRVLALCQGGKVRILNIGMALDQFMGDMSQLNYEDVPRFVDEANRRNIADASFNYRLVYRDEPHGEHNRKRMVSVRVEARPGAEGESPDDLVNGLSEYERLLIALDEDRNWVAFGVDGDSIEVFRQARSIALEMGFSTGWDPVSIEFPYEEVILGGGVRQRVEGKPPSGLGIIQ